MIVPGCLTELVEQGTIQQVVRPLLAGKEAQIYLVVAGGEERVAKVYKDARQRSFKHRAEYIEGRRVRNTRDQRAMDRGSRYGRVKQEAAWRATEFEIITRLQRAGVRVPAPYSFAEDVLIMELIRDASGNPAPRLADVDVAPAEAPALWHRLLRQVVRMLCAGVVHSDLSDFNVLMGAGGPVLIDFPQAVDATANLGARRLLVRDVTNLARSLGRFAPQLRRTQYGEEMWSHYERNALTPETPLTGRFRPARQRTDTASLLEEIAAVEREARERRVRLGLPPVRPARQPRPVQPPPATRSGPPPGQRQVQPTGTAGPPPRRRHRRRRRRGGAGPRPPS